MPSAVLGCLHRVWWPYRSSNRDHYRSGGSSASTTYAWNEIYTNNMTLFNMDSYIGVEVLFVLVIETEY
jgi:hypothetical protein